MRYEDSADQVTVTKPDGSTITAWLPRCNTRVLWLDERGARHMAATDFPCKCGGRHKKGWTCCDECRATKDRDRWAKAYANAIPWDGQEKLCEFGGDRFLWDASDVCEYLYEQFHDGIKLEDIQLVHCREDHGRHFEMSEYLCDSLPEDGEVDDAEINKIVNEWIEKNAPFSFWPDEGRPVLTESLAAIWQEIKEGR